MTIHSEKHVDMNKIIDDGKRAFHKYKGRYHNPYQTDSPQYNDYERGWTQALKRSSDQLLKRYRSELVVSARKDL